MERVIPLFRPPSGSSIGVIAPSASMQDLKPAHFRVGQARLRELGFDVRIGRNAGGRRGHVSGTPEERISDIVDMLLDPEVSLIMAVYGGYNSIDLLADFPYELMRDKRKCLVGYSDITALHSALYKITGVPSLHGPGFAALCEPNIHPFTVSSFMAALIGRDTVRVTDAREASDISWYSSAEHEQREYVSSEWSVYRDGIASGRLIGGNLSTLLALAGTRYFPDCSESILLIENNTDTPVGLADRNLSQLFHMGVFTQINGLIVGKQKAGSEDWMDQLLDKHLRTTRFPVIYSVNCSHVDPIATLPIGVDVTIDTYMRTIAFDPNHLFVDQPPLR